MKRSGTTPVFAFALALALALSGARAAPAAAADPAAAARFEPRDGDDLLRKVDEVMHGFSDQTFDAVMKVIEPDGQTRERRFRTIQKSGQKRLIRFTAPADVKGTAVLVESRDAMYVYVPAFKRVRRIAGHTRNQGFLGSDFSFEDMGEVKMSQVYAARLAGGDAESWTLELTPRPGAETEYRRLRLTVSRKYLHYTRVEYFDLSGKHVKTQTQGEFAWNDKDVDWTPTRITMTDHRRNDHRTEIALTVIATNSGLSDELFTQRALARGD